jgi:predicted molibdopterin-dependent oxidoreductase YjgC
LVLGDDVEAKAGCILTAASEGKVSALYLISSMPHLEPTVELLAVLAKVPLLLVQDLAESKLSEKAHIVLPGASFAEKDGVFVNVQRRAQVVRRAIDPMAQGHDDLLVLARVARAAGVELATDSPREIFRQLAKDITVLNGLDHKALGRGGLVIE